MDINLKLKPSKDGQEVTLQITHPDGTPYGRGNLLTFRHDGTLIRHGGVDKELGMAMVEGYVQMRKN